MALFDSILSKLKALRGVAIDDHLSAQPLLSDRIVFIKAIAKKGSDIVAIDTDLDTSYSVNDLYIGCDGMVHISRRQAGVITKDNFRSILTDITTI